MCQQYLSLITYANPVSRVVLLPELLFCSWWGTHDAFLLYEALNHYPKGSLQSLINMLKHWVYRSLSDWFPESYITAHILILLPPVLKSFKLISHICGQLYAAYVKLVRAYLPKNNMKGNQLPIITTTVDNHLFILVGLLGRPKTTLCMFASLTMLNISRATQGNCYENQQINGSRQKVVGWNAALTSLWLISFGMSSPEVSDWFLLSVTFLVLVIALTKGRVFPLVKSQPLLSDSHCHFE